MPHNKQAYDVVIIGAGIIGSTIARELSRFCVRVAVLDKAAEIPSGASRANSSMIHGGFDDVPGTVKAGFVAEGNRLYHELHKELDFHLDECGSYVCAFNEEETKRLHVLMEQGRANGVPGLEIVSGDQLREKEPNVSPAIIAALWSPTAAIVNNFEAVVAFMENAQMNGVELFLETEVTGLLMDESDSSVMGVSSSRGDFTAPVVINAAGVNSDLIARMAGDESFLIRPTRGEYFITDNRYGNLIKSFLFACPSEKGKGITVARTSEGNLLFGPSSVRQTDREDTSTTKEGLQFVMEGARRLLPAAGTHMSITTFAGVGGAGDLQAHQHQPLEHLPFEHGAWRQLVFAAGVLGNDVAHRQVQFALQHHVLVHDRGDALDRLQLLGRGGEREGKGGGNRQEGRGKAWAHGLTESGSDRNRPDRAWCCWAGPGTGRRGSSRE